MKMRMNIDTHEYCMAFDPATRTGFAYRISGTIVYGALPFACGRWRDATQSAYEHGVRNVIIEDAFLGRNARTYGMLKLIQGELVSYLKNVGINNVYIASPLEWKCALFGKHISGKTASLELARKTLNVARLDHNAADAICLLLYAERFKVFSTFKGEQK